MKGASCKRLVGVAQIGTVQWRRGLSTAADKEEVSRGAKYSKSISFSVSDVASYCDITGDSNPIHSCTLAAKEAGFSGCVVPGMLCGSLFPAIIGSRFAAAVYLSQTLTFKAPVLVGEVFVAEVEVVEVKMLRKNAKITFATRCFAENTEQLLVEGQAIALFPVGLVGSKSADVAHRSVSAV